LLVAGPDGGQTSRWGNAFALAVANAYPGTPNIVAEPVGGLDGVTGANRLDALLVPDGRSAAILPGAALLAFITGDSRVHYDPTHWTPVLAGFNSGVLMLRAPAGSTPTLATLQKMAPLRIGVAQTQSGDLAALLALARLGVATAPVFGLHGSTEKTRAFIGGAVDAVFISGEGVPEDITPLIASGAVPAFCLGAPGPGGVTGPDPLFPGLALASAFGPAVSPLLGTAYEAAAAAARVDFLLVLPRLTDPSAVALWRSAAQQAASSQAVTAAAAASSISLQPAPVLANVLTALANVPAEQPQLLAFLAKNYGWQPG
ncbi:MAG: hypothetical protein KGH91_09535, partial [Rhodospirillales bacterium]|nr:hypothetical protein [Rhodospirillales bacterium]